MNVQEVAFADNISVAGGLNSIKNYWNKLTGTSSKYSYFLKPTKPYIIAKEKLIEAQNLFAISRVKIRTEGENHLQCIHENS